MKRCSPASPQFATLTDTVNFVLEMSEDGKTIEVKSSANVVANAYWTGGGATGNGTFSGVPSLDVKGYSIRLSSDHRRVVVVRKGLTILFR